MSRSLYVSGWLALLALGGCAAPIAGALTIGELTTIGSLVSTAVTGKGLSEHALSAVTGKDCNVLGSVIDKDRKLCEEPGSEATARDFKGFFGGEGVTSPPAHRPVLVRVNGELVYTMAPVMKAADIANAETVRALPPATPRRPGSGEGEPRPVLLRVKGQMIYTMPPIAGARDIHSHPSPTPLKPATEGAPSVRQP